jgi:hypothetical protein
MGNPGLLVLLREPAGHADVLGCFGMDEHELHRAQSLALHSAVAQRLGSQSGVLERARGRVEEWIAAGGSSTPLLLRWREVLALPPDQIAAVLTEGSEEAAWLRKASPFAGALPPREREEILRAVRRRFESAA